MRTLIIQNPSMHINPKESLTRVDHILLDQFLRKGYKYEEIHKDDATVFVITYDRGNDTITGTINETYKELLRAN